jgi:hypothetical protein
MGVAPLRAGTRVVIRDARCIRGNPRGRSPDTTPRSSHTTRVVVRHARVSVRHHARIRRRPGGFSSGTGRAVARNRLTARRRADGYSPGSRLPLDGRITVVVRQHACDRRTWGGYSPDAARSFVGRHTGGRPTPYTRLSEPRRGTGRQSSRIHPEPHGWSSATWGVVARGHAGTHQELHEHPSATTRALIRHHRSTWRRPRGRSSDSARALIADGTPDFGRLRAHTRATYCGPFPKRKTGEAGEARDTPMNGWRAALRWCTVAPGKCGEVLGA